MYSAALAATATAIATASIATTDATDATAATAAITPQQLAMQSTTMTGESQTFRPLE